MYTHPRFKNTGPLLVWAIICSGLGQILITARSFLEVSRHSATPLTLAALGMILVAIGIILLCVGLYRFGKVVDDHSGPMIANSPGWAPPSPYPAPYPAPGGPSIP